MYRRAFRAAFPATVPVLMGYLSIGIAFGLMLEAIGYNVIWAFFMSLTIYAGSGQYMGVELLSTGAALGSVAVLTLILNFRHLVYGLSMLEKFRGMGLRKLYMIFSLTDETYALLSSARVPERVDPHAYYFAIAVLDHGYWILGSVIGSVAGALISFDTTGIDFAMTALFIVIAVEDLSLSPARSFGLRYHGALPGYSEAGCHAHTRSVRHHCGASAAAGPAGGQPDGSGRGGGLNGAYHRTGRRLHCGDGAGHLPDPGAALPPF